VGPLTTRFLAWCRGRLQADGKPALRLVGDNAAWHSSAEGRAWICAHNRPVKPAGTGVRIVSCPLPTTSPWLHPIEPRWLHAKRRVLEPARRLSAAELIDRVCGAFDGPHEPPRAMPHQLA
jgi:hypothetical protein